MKVIYISDSFDHPGQKKLVESLNKYGWQHHHIYAPFRGLGYKITELYNYLKTSGDEEFIMMDAFDTYCIDYPDQFSKLGFTHRLMVSGEKHCYPDPTKAHHFNHPSPWRYVNSGQIWGETDFFLRLVEQFPFPETENDQEWYTDMAIQDRIGIDYNCVNFQSVAFEAKGDFRIEWPMFWNDVTGTLPIFLHGNGKTAMDKFYEL